MPPLFCLWLVPAWFLLGLSRFVIITVTFKRTEHWLGLHDGLAARTPLTTAHQEIRARAISSAIIVASKNLRSVSGENLTFGTRTAYGRFRPNSGHTHGDY